LTALDIAYTVLVYKNTKEVWEEDLQIKASSRTDEERHHAMHHKNSSITKEGESILKGLQWLDRQWMRVLTRIAQDL
jgi:hypothetical protein